MKKIGLALSGGGARGIAHIGILKALEEFGIRPQVISGTSAGGLVGGFYAADYSPEEILGFMKHADLFSLFNFTFKLDGIFSMNSIDKIFLRHIPHDSFERLSIPLHVAATDMLKCETVYFSSGRLSTAMLATSSVPMAFPPVRYEGAMLHDGGILNNFPIEPLAGHCDKVIGIYVNSIDDTVRDIPVLDLGDRSFHLAIRADMLAKAEKCDLYLEPPRMSRFGMFAVGDADAIFNAGYDYAMSMKDRIELFQKNL